MIERDIYERGFVIALFDEMSKTYGVVNYVCSFGFCERWRRQAIDGIHIQPDAQIVEMMSGSGECWRFFQKRLSSRGRVLSLDISTEMCRRASANRTRFPALNVEVGQLDALDSGLADGCADHVVACFGLKTFSESQLARLASEVKRLLKPNGSFSFVEVSVPHAAWFKAIYLFYLHRVVPLIGRCFLGNPENYRLLGVYTERFGSGARVQALFEVCGFRVRCDELFFGCARRLVGMKEGALSKAAAHPARSIDGALRAVLSALLSWFYLRILRPLVLSRVGAASCRSTTVSSNIIRTRSWRS